MGTKGVICFDPGSLIGAPCPMLYPEFGLSLWVFSGPMEDQHWKHSAEITATCKSAGMALEIWCLVEACDSPVLDALAEFRAKAPDALKRVLPALDEWLAVVWVHAALNHSAPSASNQIAVLQTQFDSTVYSNEAAAAKSYLLPLALRFLLDRDVFLIGRGDVAQKLRYVELSASTVGIEISKKRWRASLEASKKRLTAELTAVSNRACDANFVDSAVESELSATFSKEPLPPLQLGWFFRRRFDEDRVRTWFDEQKRALEAAQSRFHQALRQQYNSARKSVQQRPAAKRFQELPGMVPVAGSVAQNGRSPQSALEILRCFQEQAKALGGASYHDTLIANESTTITTDWHRAWFANTMFAARRRPTPEVFCWTVAAVVGLVIACVAMGIPGASQPISPWGYVGKIGGFLCCGAVAVALFDLYLIRRRWKSAVKNVQDALARLQEEHFRAAERLVALGRDSLRLTIIGRNLNLAGLAIAAQMRSIDQGEYHADRLNDLLRIVDDIGADVDASGEGYGIDVTIRPEDQTAYWWLGAIPNGTPEIREGNTALDFSDNDVARRQLARLAGVSTITVRSA